MHHIDHARVIQADVLDESVQLIVLIFVVKEENLLMEMLGQNEV